MSFKAGVGWGQAWRGGRRILQKRQQDTSRAPVLREKRQTGLLGAEGSCAFSQKPGLSKCKKVEGTLGEEGEDIRLLLMVDSVTISNRLSKRK